MHDDASSNSTRDALYPSAPSQTTSPRFVFSASPSPSSSSSSFDATSSTAAVTRRVDQLAIDLTQLVQDVQRINSQTVTATTITTLQARSSISRSVPSLSLREQPAPSNSVATTFTGISAILPKPTAYHFSRSTSSKSQNPTTTTIDLSSITIPSPRSQITASVESSQQSSNDPADRLSTVSSDVRPTSNAQAVSGMSTSPDALSILSVADEAFKTSSSSSNVQPTSIVPSPTTFSSATASPSPTNPASTSSGQQQDQSVSRDSSPSKNTVLIASTATGAAVLIILLGLLLACCLRRRRKRRYQAALVRSGTPSSLPHQRPASSSLLDNMLQSHPQFFAPAVALANARHKRTTTLPSPPLRPHPALRTPVLSTLDEMAVSPDATKGGASRTLHEDTPYPRKPPPIAKSSPYATLSASDFDPEPQPKSKTTSSYKTSPSAPAPPPKRTTPRQQQQQQQQQLTQAQHAHNASTFSQAHTLAPPPSAYHQRFHSTNTRPASARPGSTRPGTAGTMGEGGERRSWVTSSSVTAPGSSYNPFDLA